MGTEEDARKLFVAGLPDTVTDDSLRALFDSTGVSITDLSLPRDRATGKVRGFAFVTLSSPEQAQRSREVLDGSLVEGRSISVRPFSSAPPARGERMSVPGERRPPPPRDDSNRTLYIGNLPYDIEEADLRSLFAELGAQDLDRIHLPMDHATGRKRGFAFVSFRTEEAAKAALAVLGNMSVRGRPCTVHLAHPRGERPPPRQDRFGGPPGGGPGGPPPRSSSLPPSANRGFGPPPGAPGGGFGADRGGPRPVRRSGGEDFERVDRGAKGMSRKQRMEEQKRRGGGNARRYMEETWDDDGD